MSFIAVAVAGMSFIAVAGMSFIEVADLDEALGKVTLKEGEQEIRNVWSDFKEK